jgi:Protein of unknown function (DUF4012)
MSAGPESAPTRRLTRRTLVLWLVLIVVVVGFALAWIVVTGLSARNDADAVRSELPTLKSDLVHGNETGAASLEERMQHQARAAHARTTGPAWWIASEVPYLGAPLKTVRGATAIVDELANRALPPALRAGQLLDPQKLRSGPDQIDPQLLGAAAAPLSQAAQTSATIVAKAQALSGSTWLGKVNTNRDELVQDVTKLHRGLADLSVGARLLPAALGETGTKRYFVAFETDAEARGLGGLPGSYAILQAHNGRLHFVRFGSDADLIGARAHIHLGADYRREFHSTFGPTFSPASGPEQDILNSNPSPHFPDSARIWMSMWEDKFHQHIDGAIATDPTALSYLLGATGGVTLTDGTVIDSSNAVAFFENGVYAKFASNDLARKRYQTRAAAAVTSKIIHEPSGDLLNSATALQRAADEGRLLIYASDPTTEAGLSDEPVGGILPETTNPFLDVAVNNGAGDKIDYYLNRTVSYRRVTCAATTATVTATFHNGAPSSGLPPTVVGYEDGHPKLRGYNRLIISLYGTDHSSVSHLTVNGKAYPFSVQSERGHPVTVTAFTFGPGQTETLVYSVKEPAATGPMIALRQPGVRPLQQTVSMPNCGPSTSAS